MPATSLRWISRKKTTTGSENSTDAAICPPKSVPVCGFENDASQIGSVYMLWSFMKVYATRYSFHAVMKAKMLVAMTPGRTSGKRMLRRMRHVPRSEEHTSELQSRPYLV